MPYYRMNLLSRASRMAKSLGLMAGFSSASKARYLNSLPRQDYWSIMQPNTSKSTGK